MEKGRHEKTFLNKFLLFCLKFSICFGSFLFVFIFVAIVYTSGLLPDITDILEDNTQQQINILYSSNLENIRTYGTNNLNNINYSDLPSDLINALLATEDRNFFEHDGLSYLGIARAFITNLRYGRIKQGGSTVSQQLAKMILRDSSRTFKRKFKEVLLTKKIEKYLRKEDILLLYFNKSYFGNGKYGIVDAGRFYFNKEVKDLELEECAMLVGLLKAPSKYNPVNSKQYAWERTKQVLVNMKNSNYITDEQLMSYLLYEMDFSGYKRSETKKQNYYFSDYVYKNVEKLNIDKQINEVSVITTLNKSIQNKVINIVNNFIEANQSRIGDTELAVVVMDKNGDILSMIGGKDYSKTEFNRATDAYRQIGSLFKVFPYTVGFMNGLEINDIFIDEPIKIANWIPENNNSRYSGEISVKEAFERSSNSVAIQIADYFGFKQVVELANKFDMNIPQNADFSIVLGTKETTLLNIMSVYATIVNDGKKVKPRCIKYILNDNNNIVYKESRGDEEQIISEGVAEKMQFLLFNVVANGTGRGAQIPFLLEKTEKYNMSHMDNKYYIGGKTGTTQKSKDAWFIGFAGDFVIGIWFGNDDSTPTKKIMGGNLPVLLWREIAENIAL